MTRVPKTGSGRSPAGRAAADGEDVHAVPRGVALVIGCHTFPTWNSWPGLFASLVSETPSWSNRIRARCCRWRSPSRSARRCSRRRAWSDLVTLVAEDPGDGWPRPWPPSLRSGSSTSPGPPRSATDWRATRPRRRCSPRRRGSTPSSSTPPTASGGCAPTWRSPSRSTGSDVHRAAEPLPAGGRPRYAERATSHRRGRGPVGPPWTGCSATTRKRRGLLGGIVDDGVLAAARVGGAAVMSRWRAGPSYPSGARRAVVRTPAVARPGWTTRRSTRRSASGPSPYLIAHLGTARVDRPFPRRPCNGTAR